MKSIDQRKDVLVLTCAHCRFQQSFPTGKQIYDWGIVLVTDRAKGSVERFALCPTCVQSDEDRIEASSTAAAWTM